MQNGNLTESSGNYCLKYFLEKGYLDYFKVDGKPSIKLKKYYFVHCYCDILYFYLKKK